MEYWGLQVKGSGHDEHFSLKCPSIKVMSKGKYDERPRNVKKGGELTRVTKSWMTDCLQETGRINKQKDTELCPLSLPFLAPETEQNKLTKTSTSLSRFKRNKLNLTRTKLGLAYYIWVPKAVPRVFLCNSSRFPCWTVTGPGTENKQLRIT